MCFSRSHNILELLAKTVITSVSYGIYVFACFCGNSPSVLHIRKLSPDQQENVTFPESDASGTDSEAFVKLPPGTFGNESWYFSKWSSTCSLFAGLIVGIAIVIFIYSNPWDRFPFESSLLVQRNLIGQHPSLVPETWHIWYNYC